MSEERVLSDLVWTPERGMETPEIRSVAWNNFLLSDEMFLGKWRTAAEIRITPETALASTVVLACCRILAETISSLPLNVMRRTDNGGSEIAEEIPLHKVLSFAPNEWQTKFEFFEQMVMNLTLWGNSYSLIRSGRYGAVSALDNLHPSRMDVERLENGRLRYSYTNPETGRLERYTQDQIMHIRWTAEPDGIKGMVPIEVAREAIALARACEIHASKYWANNAKPGVVLQTDNSLSPEAAERLRDNWERLHRGSDRSYRTAILTNGLRVEQVGFNAEQSQFIDSRRFQSEEIARVYRLPLSLVQGQSSGDLERSGQEFVTYTLVPWLRRIEGGISRSLIYNDDLFFAEFDTNGLMRGDSNSRAAFYSTMQNLGIYSINDSRKREGLPPIKDGDKHFVAMNMTPLEEAVKGKQQQDPMAAMMGAAGGKGGPPPEMPGGKPSLAGVKDGKAPPEAPKGEASEKAPQPPLKEGDVVTWGDGKIGELKHIMEEGTLDLKNGDKVEVKEGEPLALVVDPETEEEHAVKVAELKKAKKEQAIEQRRLSDQNQALYDAQEKIVRDKGRWSQADAHYQERNPFSSRGIHCRNCVYYEEGGTCEIVKGAIRPDAVCKLWIIPEERLSIPEQREEEPRAFCPGPEGGGIDNSCSPKKRGGKKGDDDKKSDKDKAPEEPKSHPPLTPESVPKVRFRETVDAETFLDARNKSTRPENFSDLDPERLANSKIFLSDDGKSGCLVDEDGDLGNVFNNGGPPKAGVAAVLKAVENGAKTLDCYDGWLPDRYAQCGFVPVAKIAFNDEYAPPGWDYSKLGRPDIVVMSYQGGPRETIRDRVGSFPEYRKLPDDKYTEDFDEAKRIARLSSDSERARPEDSGQGNRRKGRRRSRRSSGVLQKPDGVCEQHLLSESQESLIASAKQALDSDMPRVETRDIGPAIAYYDYATDVLFVSPDDPPGFPEGYGSQPNPYLHEAAHRRHAIRNPESYEVADLYPLTDSHRSLIVEEVSELAATSGREFVAEVLAGLAAGKKYGHDILALARDVAGEEVI